MVGLESFHLRRKELVDRREPLAQEFLRFGETAEETPENQRRWLELLKAVQVMDGRILEVDAWIGMLEKYPGVTRPDQLPTKGNTPNHVPVTQGKSDAQARREREAKSHADADGLIAVLPDRPIG